MLRIVVSTAGIVLLFYALIPGPHTSVTARESAHAYFDALVNRPEHWKSYSLRDQRQLETRNNGGYSNCNTCPLSITYDPSNDPDPRRQDAAKVVIPANRNSLPNQVRLPMGTADENSYFITWDAWYGNEYRKGSTGIGTHKTFQFSSDDTLWFEIQSRWGQGDGLALITGRAYNNNRPREIAFGPNVTSTDPLPSVGSFAFQPERWTRYWAVIDQRAGDDYDLTSLWVADEQRGPVHILDKLQLNAYNGKIDSFWLEFNTSTDAVLPDRGPLVAYVRNVAMLRDVVNPTGLMQRPNAGTPLPPPLPRPAAPKNLRIKPPQ